MATYKATRILWIALKPHHSTLVLISKKPEILIKPMESSSAKIYPRRQVSGKKRSCSTWSRKSRIRSERTSTCTAAMILRTSQLKFSFQRTLLVSPKNRSHSTKHWIILPRKISPMSSGLRSSLREPDLPT